MTTWLRRSLARKDRCPDLAAARDFRSGLSIVVAIAHPPISYEARGGATPATWPESARIHHGLIAIISPGAPHLSRQPSPWTNRWWRLPKTHPLETLVSPPSTQCTRSCPPHQAPRP